MRLQSCLAAGLILLSATAAVAEVKVGGKYSVKGTNIDGSSYSGTAEITASSRTTCRIVWKTGSSTSTGFCMRDEDTVAAAYQLGKAVGLVIYEIKANGTLEGTWTIADQSGVGTETLTPK